MVAEIVTDLGRVEAEPVAPLGGIEPGVYFGMPEAKYHAISALSSSGIKWLAISPMDFWARCRWLNPAWQEDEDTDAQELGSAYHARILEGRVAFYRRYAAALDPADYPNALRNTEDVKAALRARGLKIGGNKPALIARLLEADPAIRVWDELVLDHVGDTAGKTLLSPRAIARIEVAAAMIERHPDLSRCFTGGVPELTVVWYDPKTGVPCKVRIDYQKPRAMIDLKTFGNPLGKSIDAAIYGAIARYGYHAQAAHYLSAAPWIKRFAREGRIFGDGDREWCARVSDDPQWVFVFQQTGVAPLARGKVFPAGLVRGIGDVTVRAAKEKYAECIKAFGRDPWIDTAPIEPLDDAGFPAYIGQ